MKHLLTLILAFSIFSASAQVSASAQISSPLNKKKYINPTCAERGHNLIYTKSTALRQPYTIDTKDSTVTVYPAPHSTVGKCTRCAEEIDGLDKDVKITTWRRVDKTTELLNNNSAPLAIDWGHNEQRARNLPVLSYNLDDVKKVATVKNDTLFIHKRVAPFIAIEEQIKPHENLTIYYNNKPITFKTAIFDYGVFYVGKNGTEIY